MISDWEDQNPEIQHLIEIDDWKTIKWLRTDQIKQLNDESKGKLQLYIDGEIKNDDIIQGKLSDSYFLSVISSIAESPERIKGLFVSNQIIDECAFGVKTYINGEETLIVVDNYFPCKAGKPMFSTNNTHEIWVMILEKVWAKIHNNYQSIIDGRSYEVFRDLLGAPSFYYKSNIENCYEIIADAIHKKFSVVCTSNSNDLDKHKLFHMGLFPNHTYTILRACEVIDQDGKQVQLIELRNPQGTGEWKGDWCDGSEKWTIELINQLGVKKKDDGIFYMSMKDFKEYFISIHICKYLDNFKLSSHKLRNNYIGYHVVNLDIDTPGPKTFSISLKDRSYFTKIKYFKYSATRFIIVKLNNGIDLNDGCQYIGGLYESFERDYYIETEHLELGRYMVFVEMDWFDQIPVEDQTFNLTCYGEGETIYTDVSETVDVVYFLRQAFMAKFEKTQDHFHVIDFAE